MPEATEELLTLPVEVRSVDTAARTAIMRVVRYGETSRRTAGGKGERFMPGAFTRSVGDRGDRIPFTITHTGGTGQIPRGAIVARPVKWETLEERGAAELLATLRFFESDEGFRAYWRAKDGELDAGSVGFRAIEERTAADGAREVVTAALHHVCLIATRDGGQPAYDSPALLEVRAAALEPTLDELMSKTWDPALAEGLVDPAEVARMAYRTQ